MNTGIVIPVAGVPQPVNLNSRANISPIVHRTNMPPVYVDQSRSPPVPPPSEEDINQLRDMFPSIDLEIIKAILENERGNKTRAINNLLAMSN